MGNVALGVTSTDVLINLNDFIGSVNLEVFLPNANTYRQFYRERQIPAINIIVVGAIPLGFNDIIFSSFGTSLNGAESGLQVSIVDVPLEGGLMFSFRTTSIELSGWYGGAIGTSVKIPAGIGGIGGTLLGDVNGFTVTPS